MNLIKADEILDAFIGDFLNEPAVEVCRILVESGKGAFGLCGLVAGGK